MMSSNMKAAVLSLLFLSVEAKTKSIYSFAEGKVHPEGLTHGARGHACLKEFHANLHGGSDLTFLGEVESKYGGKLTDEHVAAAMFTAFGEKGIDSLCGFNERWKESHETRRRLTEASTPSEKKNPERRTQTRSCSGGAEVGYPSSSKSDPNGVYSKFVTERIGAMLPDGKGAESRTSPAKMVTEGQMLLDEALEGEYSGKICGAYFAGWAALASIPDLVVFKQGPILDGINELTCGAAESMAVSIQQSVRGVLGDGMKHDALINQAETAATYKNTVIIAEEMCSMNSGMTQMSRDIDTIKAKMDI